MQYLVILGLIAIAAYAWWLLEIAPALEPDPPEPDGLIGRRATVHKRFDPPGARLPREGVVELNGTLYSAQTENPVLLMNKGDPVRVVRIEGIRLAVDDLEDQINAP